VIPVPIRLSEHQVAVAVTVPHHEALLKLRFSMAAKEGGGLRIDADLAATPVGFEFG
jgi:hypothetical protein